MAIGSEQSGKTRKRAAADTFLAIGASAGHVKAVQHFLALLPPRQDTAIVVVLRHREALDEERFKHALSETGHVLAPAEENGIPQPGRLYLLPNNVIVSIQQDRFHMRPAEQVPGERGTIDSFLLSLASAEDRKTVAVLFRGTAGDGTLGAGSVKEAGGLVLAERMNDHDVDLGASNSPAALADAVLPIPALAERTLAYLDKLQRSREPPQPPSSGDFSGQIASIVSILRNKTGHDFHGYKQGTFLRRVQRRMQVVQVDTMDAYVEVLRAEPGEAQNLFNDLLTGVTQFFRDQREFKVLESQVVPKLFEGKTRNDQLRVWVIGCSTGEEAYSIGILLLEHMAKLDEAPQVQIFASELDGRALASARVGRFPETIVRDVPPERLARWFIKEGSTYVVVKELREICVFSQHSIIEDAPFSRIDLISCRNLLIYLDNEMQKRVIPLFHFALRTNGFLFLGNSENVSRHSDLFAPLDSRSRLFQRVETSARVMPDFPLTAVERRTADAEKEAALPPAPVGLHRAVERVVDRYAPAYIVVDADYNVVHFSGNTGRFIDPAGGAASLNVFDLAHAELRPSLRAVLSQMHAAASPVQARDIRIGVNGNSLSIDLSVEPVSEGGRRHFVIIFNENSIYSAARLAADPDKMNDENVLRLEAELRSTTERLQSTVEELESTNEELKSANEEYQSLNAELQSANEELKTSKEELQSINEELTTVSGELGHRVHELGHANSDLKNLLESTQIATVFLDNELRVMNFTSAVHDILPLVESDIGRPVSQIRARISFEQLQDDVRRVMRTMAPAEREMENSANGTRYMVRVLPYRSVDNFIGGVVITFTNLRPLTQAQEALRQSEARFRALADLVPDLLWSSDPSGIIRWYNRRWLDYTGQSQEEAQAHQWLEAIHPDDREASQAQFEAATRAGEPLVLQHRMRRKDGTYRWFLTRAEPTRDSSARVTQWFGSSTDIHDQRVALENLQESEAQAKLLLAELQRRVRNTLAVLRSIVKRTAANSETVQDYADHLDGRLSAFARVQSAVTSNPQGTIDLEQLIAEELHAHRAREGEQVSRISGPRVALAPKAGELLGLAVHELTTNAVKYGALSNEAGHLEVVWEIDGNAAEPKLIINWSESGMSFPPQRPERRGFGSELLERTLAYELNGQTQLDLKATGLQCTISVPVESLRR